MPAQPPGAGGFIARAWSGGKSAARAGRRRRDDREQHGVGRREGPGGFSPGVSGQIIPTHPISGSGGVTQHFHVGARGSTDPVRTAAMVHRAMRQCGPSLVGRGRRRSPGQTSAGLPASLIAPAQSEIVQYLDPVEGAVGWVGERLVSSGVAAVARALQVGEPTR